IAGALWRLLPRSEKIRLLFLLIFMLVVAAYEMITLAGVQVFMASIASGDLTTTLFIDDWISGLTSRSRFLVLAGLLTAAFILKLALFAVMYWALSGSVARQQVTLAHRLFNGYQYAPLLWHPKHNVA
ncbi:unnamed protein product, partial [Hapterophycus canaliculatus]